MSKQHVAVVGAGVVGSAIAVEALRGGFEVTLIDAETPGGVQSASYGSGGGLSIHSVIPPATPGLILKMPGYASDPRGAFVLRWEHIPFALPWLCRYALGGLTWEKVARTAAALYPLLEGAPGLHKLLAKEAGVSGLIEQKGLLAVFRSRERFSADPNAWTIRRLLGIEWKDLEGLSLRAAEPDLSSDFRYTAVVEKAGSCKDTGAYTQALARHAIGSGAVFRQTTATGLHLESGAVKGIYTRSGEIPCDKAVIALGASSRAMARQTGDYVSLEAERGYHLEISGVSIGPRRPMMLDDRKVVISRTKTGLRIAGQVEIAAFDALPDWGRADALLPILREVFPELPLDIPAENIKKWMGSCPGTPDGLPCIGYSSASRDVIHAFGHGQVGLSASARTARIVRQLLSWEETEIGIVPYAPSRFNFF
ncbi:MAG: FAD-binding oxidoreductase [Candidatus Accumulibacter sp.]|jgi:D-amino-acid dehydrogenase|nr:FAD-binding oxidoreductase [Accumulibacter sp.]